MNFIVTVGINENGQLHYKDLFITNVESSEEGVSTEHYAKLYALCLECYNTDHAIFEKNYTVNDMDSIYTVYGIKSVVLDEDVEVLKKYISPHGYSLKDMVELFSNIKEVL